ncbi:GNAT family N-acetyltransferase [Flavobacterium sp. Fl-77]|uniref:GNAT family N-acetyltransferase n=1 Tax=Flavobacterium flavipigmentatum TaxID=2893884 RepID=A0AAJ2W1I9_9FLAO|nr:MULTISPECIES: GNAT family N-acetyltransferase [unclassified Flavobacterium]MDX6182827.1 GNAT family N-acetyltransferase [Flavobacterium sp. Fl-33]MDX6186280.1 GNAT family N-acetyltransferase [Flavobacterium sp. Fl-77]UFH37931.1 N-acetyltransferase family protein [Flavobacterium sp. F-70]
MDIKLRPATTDDLEKILEIVNHSILHTTANYNYDIQTLEVQTKWFEDKKAKNLPIVVADLDGEVIGFGSYGQFREKIGYQYTVEHSVYVVESAIGKGVGGKLLTELIRLAKQQGIHVMIGAIDADNAGSIAFHEKYGFVVTGTLREVGYKFDHWLDLVFMQLVL